ncbi:MAG: glycosyltransferase, partial [Mariprofundaceae bacterium]|nr:glycosyltransferase [Mariprofundaceae bacterium]
GEMKVTLVARMLWDKGVGEFVEAIRVLKEKGLKVKACLVGEPDDSNPASISLKQLEAWQQEGVVKWEGHRNDINQVWAKSNIAVLPSYREGLPKTLLEAAACGRAMIATDVPGCRSIVIQDETGVLVPARNVDQLAVAIENLIKAPSLRHEMGKRARLLVERKFSDTVINHEILELYNKLLRLDV